MKRHLFGALALALAAAGGLALVAPAAADDHHDSEERLGHASPFEEQFLMTAAEGDKFEVRGGKIARNRGEADVVEALGREMIADHRPHYGLTSQLAHRLDVDVPDEPSPTQQWELDEIRMKSGHEFDRAYVTLEIADHEQDIEEYDFAAHHAEHKAVRDFAKATLPVLERHLAHFEAALQAIR